MRLIIAGSRTLGLPEVEEALLAFIDKHNPSITEIVSGCAHGVDKAGELIATALLGLPVKRFPADWTRHGKSAGMIRNREMAAYGTALLLVWDGKSRGSANMLEMARKYKLDPIEVVRFEPKPAKPPRNAPATFCKRHQERHSESVVRREFNCPWCEFEELFGKRID